MRIWIALINFPHDRVLEYMHDLRDFASKVTVDRIHRMNHGWASLIEFDVRFLDPGMRSVTITEETNRNATYSGWMRNLRTGKITSAILNDDLPTPEESADSIVGEFSRVEIGADCIRIVSDHYATHPVYYWGGNGKWIASNDMRLIFLMGEVPIKIRRDSCIAAITQSLMVGENELPAGGTFFEGVCKLQPNCTLILGRNAGAKCVRLKERKKLDVRNVARNREYYTDLFRETLSHCVSDRIKAGANGLMLSGGLDSSAILGASLLHGGNAPFCVNMSFKDDELPMSQDDKLVAMLVQERNIQSKIVYADSCLRLLRFDDPIGYLDGPEMVANPLAKEACASAFQDRGVSMVMTGEGGDAILGESMHFWIADSILAYEGLKAVHRYVTEKLMISPRSRAYLGKMAESIFTRYGVRSLKRREFKEESLALPDFIHRSVREKGPDTNIEKRAFDCVVPQTYVAHQYVKSMLFPRASYFDAINTYCVHSHPYLDPRMMDFVFACPPHFHHDYEELNLANPYATSKMLARDAYRNVLPDYVINKQSKTSYALMARRMFQNSRNEMLDLVRHPMLTQDWNLIDQQVFRKYLSAYVIATEDPNAQLGRLYHYIRGVVDLENWLAKLSGSRSEVIERIKFRPLRQLAD